MEKINKKWKKLCFLKSQYWKQYLLLGIMSQELFPFLLQTIIFVRQKSALHAIQMAGLEIVDKIFQGLFLFGFIYCYVKNEEQELPSKERWIKISKDIVVIGVLCLVSKYIPAILLQYGSFYFPRVAVVLSGVVLFVCIILVYLQVLFLVADIQPSNLEVNVKKPYFLLMTLGVLIWTIVGNYVLLIMTSTFVKWIKGGYAIQLLILIVRALINGAVYIRYFSCARRYAEPENYVVQTEEDGELEGKVLKERVIKTRQTKLSVVFVSVITIIAVLVWIVDMSEIMMKNEKKDIQTYMYDVMMNAREEIISGNTDEGIRQYILASEYMKALDIYVKGDEDALKALMEQNMSDDLYWQLYYACSQDVRLLENKLINRQQDIGLYHDLLAAYAEKDCEEKMLQEYCIQKCLDTGSFQAEYVCIDRQSINNKAIVNLHRIYDEELSYSALLKELVETNINGETDEDTLYRILDMAEANTQNIAYQLVAVEYGTRYLYDDANHYDRVLQAAFRYDELYEAMRPTQEELIKEKLYLAEIMLDCKDYADALKLLKSVDNLGNDLIEDYIMVCYNELEQQEELVAYTEELMKDKQVRAKIYYFAALSNLKLGNTDDSLNCAVKLADKVLTASEEEREANNSLLNSYVQYICIKDSFRDYIQYKYRIKSYTDSQLQLLESAPLLHNYIIATNCIYNDGEYEKARAVLEEQDKICPDLSITWFLKGTAYYNEKKYDEAMSCFKKCTQIDAENVTALYCMATLYDQSGDYEKSYQLCNQIIERLPLVNHEMDWYGVAYHVNALRERLIPYIGGSK